MSLLYINMYADIFFLIAKCSLVKLKDILGDNSPLKKLSINT